MEDNTLIEVVKSGLSIASSSISAVVGTVLTTLFLKKNTQTTEFERIKAGKFSEVIDELLDNGKMSYMEYYKCNNFLDIAKKADEALVGFNNEKEEKEENNQQYNFDWFIRFFDAASNISNEEMQKLWAAVLAGEVLHSGSYSLRALDTLYNMTPFEAELFADLSKIVIDDSKLFSSINILGQPLTKIGQKINEKYSFDNDSLRILEECGVINGLLMRSELELQPGESGGFSCGDKLLLFKPVGEKKVVIDYVCYNLTMVGLQLYPVVFSGADDQYLIELGREIKKKLPLLNVSIHPMNSDDGDCISYDSEIDLLV